MIKLKGYDQHILGVVVGLDQTKVVAYSLKGVLVQMCAEDNILMHEAHSLLFAAMARLDLGVHCPVFIQEVEVQASLVIHKSKGVGWSEQDSSMFVDETDINSDLFPDDGKVQVETPKGFSIYEEIYG